MLRFSAISGPDGSRLGHVSACEPEIESVIEVRDEASR